MTNIDARISFNPKSKNYRCAICHQSAFVCQGNQSEKTRGRHAYDPIQFPYTVYAVDENGRIGGYIGDAFSRNSARALAARNKPWAT